MFFDMHIHTTCSDGGLMPDEIIQLAASKQLSVISITDHDTLKAYSQIDYDKCKGVKIVPGIELSALKNSSGQKQSIHVLGYAIDLNNNELRAVLDGIETNRMKEIKAMIKILSEKVDKRITVRNIIASQKKLTVNAIACYLCEIGYAESKEEAYALYLHDDGVAFIQKKCLTPQEAVSIIKKAGGKAVLAHPNRINGSNADIYELISELKNVGLDGVEVYCKGMKNKMIEFYIDICKEKDLVFSAGSDFHRKEDSLGYWEDGKRISIDDMFCESIINII